ncbi:hypothetical protein APHAL10511_003464 [Amanita phalloides]|nr:hypothetical protein APHAL10511_003464 [Amanita phalloides]
MNHQTQCRCIVRGSINVDETFYVQSIARPGETISSWDYRRRIGGKGANQAVAIARAGGTVNLYGTIGRDGEWLKDELKGHGIDVDGIVVSEVPTGRALIQVANNGENSIVLFPGANHSQLHEERFKDIADDYFPGASHLLLQNEIHAESTYHALEYAYGATTILNPSPLPSLSQIRVFPWDKVNWLIVNEGEAKDLFHATIGQEAPVWRDAEEMLRSMVALPLFHKTNIICTIGARGVIAILPDFGSDSPTVICIPAAKVLSGVNDTTGAGDCFTGYFVQGLMKLAMLGREMTAADIEKILRFAVHAAAISVERPGAIDSIPLAEEVEKRSNN